MVKHDRDGVVLDHKGRLLTADGAEIPDPRPLAPPVGYNRQPSLFEMVREATRRELSLRAQDAGMDSFEDADDFEDDAEFLDPTSPYEYNFDPARDPEHPQSSGSPEDESAEGAEPSEEAKPPSAARKPKKDVDPSPQ